MSRFAPPVAGNRYVWFALTSNFSANRREFSLPWNNAGLPFWEFVRTMPGLRKTLSVGVSDNPETLSNLRFYISLGR